MEDINNVINMPEENKQEFFVADGVANNSFVKESYIKIFILSLLFSVFYPIGYFYKQWKEIKKNNEKYKNISPFWRGVFYPIFAFKFTKILDNLLTIKKNMDFSGATNEEEKKQLEKEYTIFNKFYSNSYIMAIIPLVVIILVVINIPNSLRRSIGTGMGAAVWLLLYNLQKAIDKISPQDHPKGKLTFSDFLGLPTMITFFIIISFMFPCIKIKGNTYIDTCNNYSITFPFDNNLIYREKDINSIYRTCQKEREESLNNICFSGIEFKENNTFTLAKTNEELSKKTTIVSQQTGEYNGNTAYCFTLKNLESEVYLCYMLVKDKPKYLFVFAANKEIPFENLEKMMNSYKSW